VSLAFLLKFCCFRVTPTWQALQRHVMHDLVVAALQEAGVDGAKGGHNVTII
jgi:hypothetical protein